MTDGIWLDEPFEPPQCEVPHCLEPATHHGWACGPHWAEFTEWLRRKAWREANGGARAHKQG